MQQYLDISYKKVFEEVKLRQIISLEKVKTQGMNAQAHYAAVKAVVNLRARYLPLQAQAETRVSTSPRPSSRSPTLIW